MKLYIILGNTKAGVFNQGGEKFLTKGKKEYRMQVVKSKLKNICSLCCQCDVINTF